MADMTNSMLSKQALQEARERLSQIVNGIPVAIFVIDERHVVTDWNLACANITGVPASEIIGTRNHCRVFYLSERPLMADLIVDGANEETIADYYRGEYRSSAIIKGAYEAENFFSHFGEAGTWMFYTAAPLMGSDGKVIGAIEVLQDITKRKQVEEELQRAKELLEHKVAERTKELSRAVNSLLEEVAERKLAEEALKNSQASLALAIKSTGLGTFDFDPRTKELVWSEIAKKHYGLSPEKESEYEFFLAGLHPDDRERVERLLQESFKPESGGGFSTEYRTIGIDDGKERWLAVRGQAFFNEKGEAIRFRGVCLDITRSLRVEQSLKEEISKRLTAVEELRRQEQMLIQQGRFAAMGEMIGNIAHQWRQPLNTLGLIIQELPMCYEQNLLTKQYLDESVRQAMNVIFHMSQTIDDFRDFFNIDKKRVSFKIGDVLKKTIAIVDATFSALRIGIKTIIQDDVSIYGCPGAFSQVILNILTNSKDAFVSRKVAQPLITINLFKENGRAALTIADNAGGIGNDIMDKIFDPYFTTKGPDKGTGVGLFMSRLIVREMDGVIGARNIKGGAEFRIEV